MFEKRPIWGLIVGLNVCVLIWLISVQEPVMFDVSTAAISSSSSNNYGPGGGGGAEGARGAGVGRDLLAKQRNPQSNSYEDNDEQLAVAAAISTLTTLTYNSNNLTITPKSRVQNRIDTKLKRSATTTTTTTTTTTSKASLEHNSGDITLTSSLGTGVVHIQNRPTPSWTKLTAVSSALPDEDFNQLIDLHNFQYLMPQPVCSHHIEALILIHSAPKNYEKRQLIRETWGSIGHHTTTSPLRVLFLLGAVDSQQLQEELTAENTLYKDIIQGSFVDDYRNMTYKHIMAFKWFLYNCAQSQILIKVDDDVYVNTPQLIKYLKEQQQEQQEHKEQLQQYQINNNINPTITNSTRTTTTATMETPNSNNITNTITKTPTTTSATNKNSIFQTLNIFAKSLTPTSSSSSLPSTNQSLFNASLDLFQHPSNLLFCQKIIGSLVKRSYRSKWRVSFKEYSERYYPPYCPGYAIIYSPDIIFRLYTAAQNFKYFWIDDVHITGVLAQQTNTTITTSSHYVLYSDECDQLLSGKTDLNEVEFLFAWHSITAQKIKALWHLQMMSLKNLNDLHYKKKTDNERLAYNIINASGPSSSSSSSSSASSSSSSLSYTSLDGLR